MFTPNIPFGFDLSDDRDLIVKSVTVTPVHVPIKNGETMSGYGLEATVKNIGRARVGASRTSFTLIKADSAQMLASIETPTLAAGEEVTLSAFALDPVIGSKGGAIVILANSPDADQPQGRATEGRFSIAGTPPQVQRLNNAFGVPYSPTPNEVMFVNPAAA